MWEADDQLFSVSGKHMGGSSRAAVRRTCPRDFAQAFRCKRCDFNVQFSMCCIVLLLFTRPSGRVIYAKRELCTSSTVVFHRRQLFRCGDNADKYTASIVLFPLLTLSTVH